ncbi:MAG TPA: histidinol-phosphate transaminase [Pseudomonadales bacterium]|nr:histidinol-phosphate transaminase [Pseudomonadales bacterium]HMZ92171.1 histidinol-phosphate transaminase [Pseudomonadales bacterium]
MTEPSPPPEELHARLEQWIRPELRSLAPYHVADASGCIKLDAMENPYPWPGTLTTAWLERLSSVELNRYPDPQGSAVKQALRRHFAIAEHHALLLGNGSDELILLLALLFGGTSHCLLAPEPGFVMYSLIARQAGMAYCGVALTEQFELDRTAMLAAIAERQPAVIFIAQPNNPTGNLFDPATLRAVIEAAPGVVVIDEAYCAFTDTQHLPLLDEFPHLLVMRTLSKIGLAGLRLGLLIGAPALIERLDSLRLPYNINSLTQASACFALEHASLLTEQSQQLRRERSRLFAALQSLPGITPYASEANFILLRVPAGEAPRLQRLLKARHRILIKCLDGGHPLLRDCLRITVGTPAENDALLDALTQLLCEPPSNT